MKIRLIILASVALMLSPVAFAGIVHSYSWINNAGKDFRGSASSYLRVDTPNIPSNPLMGSGINVFASPDPADKNAFFRGSFTYHSIDGSLICTVNFSGRNNGSEWSSNTQGNCKLDGDKLILNSPI